jgi:hypothetical protein
MTDAARAAQLSVVGGGRKGAAAVRPGITESVVPPPVRLGYADYNLLFFNPDFTNSDPGPPRNYAVAVAGLNARPLASLLHGKLSCVLLDGFLRGQVPTPDLDSATGSYKRDVTSWSQRALELVDQPEVAGSELVYDKLGDSFGELFEEDVGREVMLLFHHTSRPVAMAGVQFTGRRWSQLTGQLDLLRCNGSRWHTAHPSGSGSRRGLPGTRHPCGKRSGKSRIRAASLD